MDLIIGRTARYAGLILRNTSCRSAKLPVSNPRCLYHCETTRWKSEDCGHLQRRLLSVHCQPNFISARISLCNCFPSGGVVTFSTDSSQSSDKDCAKPPAPEKQSIFQRMKQMTKDYWYILIPVHAVTSISWMSIFYIAAKNGVDIVKILESLHLSERYLDILRGSSAGHWAVAYALYKLFTPIRYTVTVGGTTMAIRYLNRWGYLKFKPQSTIKEKQSSKCATENRGKKNESPGGKAGLKDQQQTETSKT